MFNLIPLPFSQFSQTMGAHILCTCSGFIYLVFMLRPFILDCLCRMLMPRYYDPVLYIISVPFKELLKELQKAFFSFDLSLSYRSSKVATDQT